MKKMSRELQKSFEQNLPQHALDWVNEFMKDYEEKCREYYELKEDNRRLQDKLMELSGMYSGQRGGMPSVGFRPQGEHYPPEIYGREGYTGQPYPYRRDEYEYRRDGRGFRGQRENQGGNQSGQGGNQQGGSAIFEVLDWAVGLKSQRENPRRTGEGDDPNQ